MEFIKMNKTCNLCTVPDRYNVIVGFEKVTEWHGLCVSLHQWVLKKGCFPTVSHCFLLIRSGYDRWLYIGLTFDGIQYETITTDLILDDVVMLVPLTLNLEEVEDRLQILEDMEGLLGKSFRYSPLGCLDNDAWLNCSSFVSTILGLGHISTPSELATLLLLGEA